MKRFKWILLLILSFSALLYAQDAKTELEKAKKKKEQERLAYENKIKKANKLLEEQKGLKNSSRAKLRITNSKIQLKTNRIKVLEAEKSDLEAVILRKSNIISALEHDLTELKMEYKKLIIDAYRHNNGYNQLLFLFESTDFNDLFNRLRYLEHYTQYREQQADIILETKSHIAKKIVQLNQRKNEKVRNLAELTNLKDQLLQEKTNYNQQYQKAKNQIKDISKDKREYEKKKAELKKQIDKIIADIIYLESSKDEKLSRNFQQNKSKLPWPIRGVITGKYGPHKHPIYDIVIENTGIDIAASKNSELRTVFNGKVVEVIFSAAFQKCIIVSHGNFFTVYSNLKEVYVEKGDELKTADKIGRVYTDNNGKTELHFEIWEKEETLNPERWLLK